MIKSSGIAHATKSKIELGVAGKDGFFDDLKVRNAQRSRSHAALPRSGDFPRNAAHLLAIAGPRVSVAHLWDTAKAKTT